MRGKTRWLYVNHPSFVAVGSSKRLSTHVIYFIHPHFLLSLQYHYRFITADAQWFLLQRNVRNANGVIRIPFDMGKIYDYYHIPVSHHRIFSIGKTRLSKKNEMDWSYSSQFSREGLFVFHSLIIHIINWLGWLPAR